MPTARTGGWLDSAIRTQLNVSNLTAERERHLLRICQTATDRSARQAALTDLWQSHSKLVIAIAARHRQANIELADLIGAGHLGLHAAIKRFDPDKFESRLATYAVGWIRWHVQDYIRCNAAPIRLPATTAHRRLARMATKLVAEARKSCQREKMEATETELCRRIGQRIGLDGDEVARSMRLIRGGTVSLYASITKAGLTQNLEDTLAAEDVSPEEDVMLRLDQAKIRKRIMILIQEVLGQRERETFLARCMGDSDDVVHLESLARRFGVSRERVCQLEASAKRKIAAALAREGYAGVLSRLPATRARRRPVMPPGDFQSLPAVAAAE